MNWLAHFLLSEPTPPFRVGSILPDLVPASALANLPREFQRGAAQHHQVDAFTDLHPTVRTSKRRFPPPLRRFSGIIVDVAYDHFLACDWGLYSPMSLPEFAAEIYASFEVCRAQIPVQAYGSLERMKDYNWLCSYRELEGISIALGRIGMRLRRPVDLAASVSILRQHYDALQADFRSFFPELLAHVTQLPERGCAPPRRDEPQQCA